jgi:tetratricopeptide (TPR) repeat protein
MRCTHGHNVNFLSAAYAFDEKYDQAVEAARGLLAFKENPREAAAVDNSRTAYRQGWFSLMRALVYFEKYWATGLAHAARNSADAAKREAEAMEAALKDLAAKTKQDVPKPLEVAREELAGHIANAGGKTKKAIEILQSAARRERALRYNEPPAYPRPVLEALGKLALASGRTDVAEAAFREALEQYPESPRALRGLQNARRRGD